ncbi:MAG: MMPL family transporter, partial [Bacteroidota bacterium]
EADSGVINVFGVTRLYDVIRDDSAATFVLKPVVQRRPETQAEVDSLTQRINDLPFYRGLLIDETGEVNLLAVSLDPDMLDTDLKIPMVHRVKDITNRYAKKWDTEPRFAGLPILRVNSHETIKQELYLFLGLALIVTALTLLIFFRSLLTVIFPMLVVGCVIIFSMGLIGLLGYKMSLITGIIPALITVISIPNSVYLITKYHIEFKRTRNKVKSLILVIEKIGIVTVMTNATTGIGLGVLAFTDIKPLQEFGVVAGLSVVAAFFISLMLIPVVFSFAPPPSQGQLKHLERRGLSFIIRSLDRIVLNYRWAVYLVTTVIVGVSIYGLLQVKPVAYMADDIPQDSKVLQDLRYVENRFNGALPFEILIDTGKRRGVLKRRTIQNIDKLQKRLDGYEDISQSISVANFAKFFRQALFNGGPTDYELPSRDEFNFIADYAKNIDLFGDMAISKSLTDPDIQITRVSASVRDIGSLKMQALVDSVRKDVEEIFPAD